MSDQLPHTTVSEEPLLWEKVLVHASSPSCKCLVAAIGRVDCGIPGAANLHVLIVKKCRNEHDAVIERLSAAAKARAAALVESLVE